MSIAARIKKVRINSKLSQERFGEKVGVSRSTLAQIEIGAQNPTLETIVQIVKNFNIDYSWLMEDSDNTSQLVSEPEVKYNENIQLNAYLKTAAKINENVNLNVNPSVNLSPTPVVITLDQTGNDNIVLVDTKAAASYPLRMLEPEFYGDLNAFSLPGQEYRNGIFRAFEVSGDSMYDTLYSGDVVIARYLDRHWQDVREGYVHVIVTEAEVLVKRVLNRVKSAQKLILQSDNTAYGNIALHVGEVKEIWLVKGKITLNLPNRNRDVQKILDDLQARVTLLESGSGNK